VERSELPVERGVALTPDDLMRRYAINQVMCQLRLDLREVERRFGAEARVALAADLDAAKEELLADGLVTVDGDLLRVTPLGQLLVRNVAMVFDAYLKKAGGKKQFSRTV
jgi:oxygen-independent coproporphyrinogen-3 oxidase